MGIKSGQVIQFLNWFAKFQDPNYSNISSSANPFLLPIGSIKPPEVLFEVTHTLSSKMRALENHAKTLIQPDLKFDSQSKMEKFLSHLEFIYKIKLKKRLFGIYMGSFWFECMKAKRG